MILMIKSKLVNYGAVDGPIISSTKVWRAYSRKNK